jgi:hypothetical protein
MKAGTKMALLGHNQIEALVAALLKASHEADTDNLAFLVQALSIRILELNGALMGMAAVGQDADIVELKSAVLGHAYYRSEVAQ